jgi:hypothetical protein
MENTSCWNAPLAKQGRDHSNRLADDSKPLPPSGLAQSRLFPPGKVIGSYRRSKSLHASILSVEDNLDATATAHCRP